MIIFATIAGFKDDLTLPTKSLVSSIKLSALPDISFRFLKSLRTYFKTKMAIIKKISRNIDRMITSIIKDVSMIFSFLKFGAEDKIRTYEGLHRQIYSLLPLTAWLPQLICSLAKRP